MTPELHLQLPNNLFTLEFIPIVKKARERYHSQDRRKKQIHFEDTMNVRTFDPLEIINPFEDTTDEPSLLSAVDFQETLIASFLTKIL